MTYTQIGDYQIPNLTLGGQPKRPLGKYGRMRKAFLQEHRPILFQQLLLTGKLYLHCLEIEDRVQAQMRRSLPMTAAEIKAAENLIFS